MVHFLIPTFLKKEALLSSIFNYNRHELESSRKACTCIKRFFKHQQWQANTVMMKETKSLSISSLWIKAENGKGRFTEHWEWEKDQNQCSTEETGALKYYFVFSYKSILWYGDKSQCFEGKVSWSSPSMFF